MTEAIFDSIPKDVLKICQRLRDEGQRGWVVGGCVRDLLRGAPAKDWDIATDAEPKRVQKLFRKVIPTGIKHGTVTVLMNGTPYEVTTLRGEGAYEDGRRPTSVVFLQDITEDLARRDFTFNAIALDPLERRVIDPFEGERDLRDRRLRAVGDAHARFCEDGLRILRAARFAATLECDVDPDTLQAMGASEPLATLAKVSAERIHDEWLKTMRAARPSIAFGLMQDRGVMTVIAPELAALADDPAWTSSLHAMDGLDGAVRRLAALLSALGPDTAETLLERLKFSNEHRKAITMAVAHHEVDPSLEGPALRRWLQSVTPAHLDDALAVAGALSDAPIDALGNRARAELEAGVALTTKDLAVTGRDLMTELSLKPGPHLGVLLKALLEACIEDPRLNTRTGLLERARQEAQ